MPKRLGLNLSDDTHAQIKQRADAAGISVNAWILAAIERETFRQLCQETNAWWAERPELAEREHRDYFKRLNGDRDSSAA
ncbi:hypothetical protein [Amycolatopsis sp. NPDC059657]|uniref:hypothetical protein n=1 Tax=Amycolatopsis sp. NPDC059657 TaxID=3346899 RepID=UPI003670EB33